MGAGLVCDAIWLPSVIMPLSVQRMKYSTVCDRCVLLDTDWERR